jgi:hypothetical protein
MDFSTNTLVSTISGGFQSRAIAYDSDLDVFYVSNWGDPVWIVDRTGSIVGQFDLVTTTSTYGFAYDSSGPYLWVFDQTTGATQTIYQWDLTTGAFTGVTHNCDPDFNNAGIAGGLFLTDEFATGYWTIGGLSQGTPDIIFQYEYMVSGPAPGHDVGAKTIVEPSTGDAGIITPKVNVQNYGNNSEVTDVNLMITKGTAGTPPVTLYSVDFTPGPGLPTDWTIVDGGTSNDTWWYDIFYSSPGPGATCDSDGAGSGPTMDEEFISPAIDCSAATNVEIEYDHYFYGGSGSYTNQGDVYVWDGTVWVPLVNYAIGTTASGIETYDVTSAAAGNSAFKVKFHFQDFGSWGYGWTLFDFEVRSIDPGSIVMEYNQTVTGVTVNVGETVEVVFPDWTPTDWMVAENVDIDYDAIACTLLVDDVPANDCKDKAFTLSYGFLHDIEVVSIDSPTQSGTATENLPVEVTIKNVGAFPECCFFVNTQIGEQLGNFIDEDFSGGVPPAGWTTTHPSNWGSSSTSNAGGVSPEARFSWTPSSTGTFRLHTGAMDTTGYTTMTLKFKEYVNDYNSNYNLGVETSTDGVTWTTVYSRAGGPYGPTTTEIPLTAAQGMGSSSLYVSFTYFGNSFNINYWYIDDVELKAPSIIVEYDENRCVPDGVLIDPGEELALEFPDWTAAQFATGLSATNQYMVIAESLLPTDTNPANNIAMQELTLEFWHDVSIKDITSPGDKGKDLLWDNYGVDATSTLLSSQLEPVYPFVSHMADDFVLSSTAAIDHIKFWGGFWNGNPVDPVDINIYFFADDNGVPTGSGMPDPSSTALYTHSATVSGVVGAYATEYDMDIPAFVANGGTTYWLSVQADLIFPPQFGWATNGGNPDQGAIPVQGFPLLGTNYWTPTTYGDMAFQLEGTVGGTPGADVFVAPGVQTISAIVDNTGTWDEFDLDLYGEIYEFITNATIGTLVWSDVVNDIDINIGDELPIDFGTTYDFAIEGIYQLQLELPMGNDDYPDNNAQTIGIGCDDTPPTSTHTLDPAAPTGLNGWYVDDVTVTITGDDGSEGFQSGVDHIEYRIDGGSWQSIPNGGSFVINTDGEHTIDYKAVDGVDNEEAENTFDINMDQTPPTVDLTWESVGGLSSDILFTATCDDATSGMDYVEFLINGVLQHTDDASPYEWILTYVGGIKFTVTAIAYDVAGLNDFDELGSGESVNVNVMSTTPLQK